MKLTKLSRPENPGLFEDFLHHPERVRDFYRYDFREDWQTAIDERLAVTPPRAALAKALAEQNRGWSAPVETFENINALRGDKTLAVVTGQQAGMLGGPLYTFYKTMSIIRLARQLQGRYPGYRFVPVFWMEVNDSDFQEIATIRYVDKTNALKTLTVTQQPGNEDRPIAVRPVHPELQSWKAAIDEDFFDTEFKAEALKLFLSDYREDQTYADAFARLILKFFGRHGLIVLNPAGKGICQLVKPLFQRALSEAAEILGAVSGRSKQLEAVGYPTQIHFNPNQTLLFFNDADQRRVRIDMDGAGGFQLKYPDGYRPIDREMLLQSCVDSPEYLSPNVALRPLMQDTLLPTVAYVGGPSEVAYFAQVEALYRYFDIPMPVICPRHRLTIVEGKIQKNVQKYELEYQKILDNQPNFIEAYLKKSANQAVFEAVSNTDTTITESLAALSGILESVDPTLVSSLLKTSENIQGNFQKLSGKILSSLEQKNETQVRQLERILLYLMPGGNFQERSLSMIYFVIKYGPGFVDELMAALPDSAAQHQVLEI